MNERALGLTSQLLQFDPTGDHVAIADAEGVSVVDLRRDRTLRIAQRGVRSLATFREQVWLVADHELVRYDLDGRSIGEPMPLPVGDTLPAISMIQDETALFHWLRKEAKEAQSAAVALAGGMTMAGAFNRNERDAAAYAEGQKAAKAAMASVQVDEQSYALAWKQNEGRRQAVIDQCWRTARATYDAAVERRAKEVYNNSWSERFWKTEADFLSTWRQKGYEAWPAKG